MYRRRFNLTHHPLPKNAMGKTFFDQGPDASGNSSTSRVWAC